MINLCYYCLWDNFVWTLLTIYWEVLLSYNKQEIIYDQEAPDIITNFDLDLFVLLSTWILFKGAGNYESG